MTELATQPPPAKPFQGDLENDLLDLHEMEEEDSKALVNAEYKSNEGRVVLIWPDELNKDSSDDSEYSIESYCGERGGRPVSLQKPLMVNGPDTAAFGRLFHARWSRITPMPRFSLRTLIVVMLLGGPALAGAWWALHPPPGCDSISGFWNNEDGSMTVRYAPCRLEVTTWPDGHETRRYSERATSRD